MTKTLMTLATVGVLGVSAVAAPTTAQAHGGALAAGIIGGLAAGAIVGSAVASPYYYGPGPSYDYGPGPYAYGGDCYVHRERVWTGYGWHIRHVRTCD